MGYSIVSPTVCCKISRKFHSGGFFTASRLNFETSKIFYVMRNPLENRVKLVRTSDFDEKIAKKIKNRKKLRLSPDVGSFAVIGPVASLYGSTTQFYGTCDSSNAKYAQQAFV